MEPPSLLSQQYSYALIHQQQQPHHHHQPQQPQAPGIFEQHQQQTQQTVVGQPAGTLLAPPLNAMNNNSASSNNTTIGQKRDFSGQPVNANSQDSQDGGNFVKLFVGSVPRTITEEEVRPMFAEHGNVLEVALIKDKRTGQQQGCCFIKYGTIEEAERAIRALNNQRTLPGGTAPVQVRYADGERERLGAVEHKLFVGSLNKQASEKEIQELFAPYGRVDDVYIMRDEQKQSRGCAFIKYPTREMATAAISALNGIYVMPGCDQPLAVRFADPKRPKGGDTRVGGPGFGGPAFNSRAGAVGNRPAPAPIGQMGGRGPPMGWRPMGGPGMGPQAQMGPTAYGGSMGPRGGPGNAAMGPMNGHPQGSLSVPNPMVGLGMLPPAQQQILQGYYQQNAQRQPQSYPPQASPQQPPYGQLSTSQQQPQQQSSQQLLSMQSQQPIQLSQGQGTPLQHVQQLQPPQQQLQPPQQHLQSQQQLQQQPQALLQSQSQQPQQQQLAQQQQQPLQQKQAYYQVQQVPALQQAQPQSSWLLPVQSQTISSLPPPPALPATCEWTEHTSPEGYKYYHNSSTQESKWEKPEELLVFEQQQQQVAPIQQQPVSTPQYSGSAVIAQHPIQGINYGQAPPTNGAADQPRQQGPPGANLFVFRIPDDFTDETLKETFAPFGNVVSSRVGVERESGRNRGFGFISYDNAASAESAIQGLNNVLIGGRRLKVERKRGEENGVQNFQPY
ncbi:unnamed protein product [Calypogeia fissa]